ncbi:MAG TPA: metal ABC transporter ATP-binding protein [Mycobacteriales bacterium]|jgi:zinc transport system ATP-binding protein|nr:metal ABC transporter ATP-binding protein [Mycobacteriales bacterium]
MTAAFDLRGGRVVLGGATVLHDVDFAAGADEFVAVLGANGSGKSTLVRTLLRLHPLAGGTLRVFGVPVRDFADWSRVGYVPQRLTSATGVPATVREVVLSGRTPRVSRWRRLSAADRHAADGAVEAVGLAHRRDAVVATLSGGQQQRVLIARALAGEPDVLVLDEPTAGVDAESQDAFAGTLRLLKERGVGVLLVSHHLGALADLVDRVVVVGDGTIGYDGPVPPGGMPDDDHHHPGVADPTRWGLA